MKAFKRAKEKQGVIEDIKKYVNGRWIQKLGGQRERDSTKVADPAQRRDVLPPKKNRP